MGQGRNPRDGLTHRRYRPTVWLLALAMASANAQARHAADTMASIESEFAWACKPGKSIGVASDAPLLWSREEAARQALLREVRKATRKSLENLPAVLQCIFLKAELRYASAHSTLYSGLEEKLEEVQERAFSEIASLLKLPTIKDLYLHTGVRDRHGNMRQSAIVEPLTEAIRRGIEIVGRHYPSGSAQDYVDNTVISRQSGPPAHRIAEVATLDLMTVLAGYGAAERMRNALDDWFDDGSPWSLRKRVEESALVEFRHAQLEALRRGPAVASGREASSTPGSGVQPGCTPRDQLAGRSSGITLQQYERLREAVAMDKGDKGDLTWAAHALTFGPWSEPVPLHVFSIHIRASRNYPAMRFLFMPGHPRGPLRYVDRDDDVAKVITEGIDGEGSRCDMLFWLRTNLTQTDLGRLALEFRDHRKREPSLVDKLLESRASDKFAAVPSQPDEELTPAGAFVKWVAESMMPERKPTLRVTTRNLTDRPIPFLDALTISHASRVRRLADPEFVDRMDADFQYLQRFGMMVVQESLSVLMLPFPAKGMEKIQLGTLIGSMSHAVADYARAPVKDALGTAELMADLFDLSIGVVSQRSLGAFAKRMAGTEAGMPRLYQDRAGRSKWWLPVVDTLAATFPADDASPVLPVGASFWAVIDTPTGKRKVPVATEGGEHRVRLRDGGDGPRVHRVSATDWALDFDTPNTLSPVAQRLPEAFSTDAATFEKAADILRTWQVDDAKLLTMNDMERRDASPLALAAEANAWIEHLPERVRDAGGEPWTDDELSLIAPMIARQVRRPITVLSQNGDIDIAVGANGEARNGMPSFENTLRFQWVGERFLVLDDVREAPTADYPSLFAAVAHAMPSRAGSRWSGGQDAERALRERVAATLASTSSRALLDELHRRWVDPQPAHATLRERAKELSRLRQVLLDKRHALDATEERRLLEASLALLPKGTAMSIEVREHRTRVPLNRVATGSSAGARIVIEADMDTNGNRIAYYRVDAAGEAILSRPVAESLSPILDVLLNARDGTLRKALGRGEWEWRLFADDLMRSMARA